MRQLERRVEARTGYILCFSRRPSRRRRTHWSAAYCPHRGQSALRATVARNSRNKHGWVKRPDGARGLSGHVSLSVKGRSRVDAPRLSAPSRRSDRGRQKAVVPWSNPPSPPRAGFFAPRYLQHIGVMFCLTPRVGNSVHTLVRSLRWNSSVTFASQFRLRDNIHNFEEPPCTRLPLASAYVPP